MLIDSYFPNVIMLPWWKDKCQNFKHFKDILKINANFKFTNVFKTHSFDFLKKQILHEM